MNVIQVPEMVSLNEASRRTGLSYDLLRRLCLTNEIVHIKTGVKYLVNFPRLCDYLNGGGRNDDGTSIDAETGD